jgi:hypothetical protein
VPDELLSVSYKALLSAGFSTCMEDSPCKTPSDFEPSPPPAKHLHINQDNKLSLFGKSQVLWSLHSLDMKSTDSDDENIILASDPRLPSSVLGHAHGALSSSLYPIRIRSANRYTEALIRLFEIDFIVLNFSEWQC